MIQQNGSQNIKYRLGFSPCPNDTFMFDALIHKKIDTEGLDFDVKIDDVESLNQSALSGELDITKISFAAFVSVTGKYSLLNAGSALGNGVGPLLIRKPSSTPFNESNYANLVFAIPGIHTTANFLFSLFYPEGRNKKEMVFSEIENAVLSGVADAGVIIHENRFTYADKGLEKICDLGERWEQATGKPVPLGGIAVRNDLTEETRQKIDRVLRRSVEFAFAHPDSSREFVKQHAREMDETVRQKHIATYVNSYSTDLGETGRNAVLMLFEKARQAGLIKAIPESIFTGLEKPALKN